MTTFCKLVLCLLALSSVACRSTPYTEPNCQNSSDPSCSPIVGELTAPTGVTAQVISHNTIKVSWESPVYSEEFSIVLEKKSENDSDFTIVETFNSTTTSHEVEGLNQVTAYTFRLQAISGSEESNYSEEITKTTEQMPIHPAFPTPTLSASIYSMGVINIAKTWTNFNNMFYVTDIEYERKHITANSWSLFTPVINGQYTLDNNPLPGSIVYRIRVTYSDGSEYVSATSNSVVVRLDTPTDFSVEEVILFNNIIKHEVTWDYGTSPAAHTGYEVMSYFSNNTGEIIPINSPSTMSHLYLPDPCPTGSLLSYWMRAVSTNPLVLPSNVTPMITMTCP